MGPPARQAVGERVTPPLRIIMTAPNSFGRLLEDKRDNPPDSFVSSYEKDTLEI